MLSGSSDPIDAARVERIARLFDFESDESEATTAAYASGLETLYTKYYHHAFPFEPRVLLDVWARCREAPMSREKCEQLYRANEDQIRISELAGGQDSASVLARCESMRPIGFQCQKGVDHARQMME